MEMVVEVVGMKAFKGTVDGSSLDGGTLYSLVRLDTRYNRAENGGENFKCGHALEEWKLPTAEHVLRLKHLNPSVKNPVFVRLEIERVSNGKESKEIVVDCLPVEPAEAQRKPVAPALAKAA